MKTYTETLDPSTCTGQQRQTLIEEMYRVQATVFRGVSRDEFVQYVIDSSAQQSWIQLFRNSAGELVGYLAVHRFDIEDEGELCSVFRSEAGMLREYRGRTNVGMYLGRIILGHLLRRPLRKTYFLGCLIHPSSYHGMVRYASEIWPHPSQDMPQHIERLMSRLGEQFGLQEVDADYPLVRQVGWITQDSQAERLSWAQSDKPAVSFFLQQNPGYGRGHGLLTLIPQSLRLLMSSCFRAFVGRLKRDARRALRPVRESLQSPVGRSN